jgi:hypothetical protein
VPKERVVLEDEARAALLDRKARGVLAVEQDASRGRKLQPAKDAKKRGLARAEGPSRATSAPEGTDRLTG